MKLSSVAAVVAAENCYLQMKQYMLSQEKIAVRPNLVAAAAAAAAAVEIDHFEMAHSTLNYPWPSLRSAVVVAVAVVALTVESQDIQCMALSLYIRWSNMTRLFLMWNKYMGIQWSMSLRKWAPLKSKMIRLVLVAVVVAAAVAVNRCQKMVQHSRHLGKRGKSWSSVVAAVVVAEIDLLWLRQHILS